MNTQKFFCTKNIVYLSILTALLVVLNLIGTVFKIVTNINLTLIPIALGALILGMRGGLILGLISGLMTFIFGVSGVDGFTNILFSHHPIITFLLCIVKITAAGVLGGLIYKLLKDKNKYLATFIASAIVPIINTAIFIFGSLIFMYDTFSAFAVGEGVSVVYYLLILCAGTNFIIEFAISLLVSPAIYSVVGVLEKNVFNNR